MKKRHSNPMVLTLLTTALLGIGALPALAQNPPYTPGTLTGSFENDLLAQPTDQFSLTVMPYLSGESDGSDFVGLTQGYLNDVTLKETSVAFYMFCVDFHDGINVPTTYDITIESLVGTIAQGGTKPDPGLGLTLQELQTQAILGADFGDGPPPTPGNPNQVQIDLDAQHDIWNMSGGTFTPATTGMTDLLTAADTLYNDGQTYTSSFLFDPTAEPGQQAFMPVSTGGFNNNVGSPTPEPGTLAMLGLGLIGLGSFKLRKAKR